MAHNDTKVFISYHHEELQIAKSVENVVRKMYSSEGRLSSPSPMHESDINPLSQDSNDRQESENDLVFISENKLFPGVEWLSKIRQKLKQSDFIIVICSPDSVKRPWVRFECGAAQQHNKPIIAYCHSGMSSTTSASRSKSKIILPDYIANYNKIVIVNTQNANVENYLDSNGEVVAGCEGLHHKIAECAELLKNTTQTQPVRKLTRHGAILKKHRDPKTQNHQICTLTRIGDTITVRIGDKDGKTEKNNTPDPDSLSPEEFKKHEKQRLVSLIDMHDFISESYTQERKLESYVALGVQNCLYSTDKSAVYVGVRYKSRIDANASNTSLSIGKFNTGYKLIRFPGDAEEIRSLNTLQDLFVTQRPKHYATPLNRNIDFASKAEKARRIKDDKVFRMIDERLNLFGSRLFKIKLVADEPYSLDYGWASLLVNNSTWRPRFEIGVWKYMEVDYSAETSKEGLTHLLGFGEDVFQDYRGNTQNPKEDMNFWIWCNQGIIAYRSYPEEQFIQRNKPQRQTHFLSHSVLISSDHLKEQYGVTDDKTLFVPDELLMNSDSIIRTEPGTPATRLLTWF